MKKRCFTLAIGLSIINFSASILYSAPVTNGLVAYWQFEQNTIDSSGRGHSGTLYGNAGYTATSAPNLGYSLHLDGNYDYMSVADHSDFDFTSTNSFSVTMWINPTAVNVGWKMLFNKWVWGVGSQRAYDFRLENDDLFLSVNSSWSTIPSTVIAGQWQQVAFTYDNTYVKAYLNGTYQGQWERSGPLESNDTHLLIGAANYNTINSVYELWHYDGFMDEIKFFSRALSNSEINQEYNYVLNELGADSNTVPEPLTVISLMFSLIAFIRKLKR